MQVCAKDMYCVEIRWLFSPSVFGVDLTTIAKMDGSNIPNVVKECIEAIEARGMWSSTFPFGD